MFCLSDSTSLEIDFFVSILGGGTILVSLRGGLRISVNLEGTGGFGGTS